MPVHPWITVEGKNAGSAKQKRMYPKYKWIIAALICPLIAHISPVAAQNDSLATPRSKNVFIEKVTGSRAFEMTYIGVPLIISGLVVKSKDDHFRSLRNDYMPTFKRHFDDYSQFLPAAVMCGLKAGGMEGRSSWGRMLVSDAFSALLMGGAINTLKYTTHVTRPDGSNTHSFPSGHTATAFMTATMLTKEYGDTSPWIGIGAYSVASATGLMRMANNKHWLSDVLTGAGIGILSTEIGYYLADLIFKQRGINQLGSPACFDPSYAPSFLGIYLGLNIMPGEYRLEDHSSARFSSGSTAGIEGAYFLNPHIGLGGRFSISNTSVIWNNHAAKETLDLMFIHGGVYFSYPVSSRLLIGSKCLLGSHYYSTNPASARYLKRKWGGGIGTGLSLLFRAKENFGVRLQCDYTLFGNCVRSDKEMAQLWVVGGAANITF